MIMTNQYKATSAYGQALFGSDVFEADLTASEEKDHLDGKHIEIVPRAYEVLSDNFSGGPKGSEYTAALVKDVESALIDGYHLRRVATKPVPKKKAESPEA